VFDRSRCEPKQLILGSLRARARGLDPAAMSFDDAVAAMQYGAEVERLGSAIKTIAAGRAAEGDAWRRAGDRSAGDWLAKQTGSTVGEARSTLEVAAKLPDAPATSAALRDGRLSPRQAAAIVPAAAADPAAESRLLEMAATQALQKVTDECARVRAAADPDPAARHARLQKERFWRKYRRADGMACGSYGGTPEEVAMFEANVQAWVDERLDRARRNGESEPSEAYAFDGLMAAASAAAAALYEEPADVEPAEDAGVVTDDESTVANDDGTDAEPAQDDARHRAPRPPVLPDLRTVRDARGGRGRKRFREKRELIGIVNLDDWRHRFDEPGPTCEIPGYGSIPIHVACEIFGEAYLTIVIRKGVDVVGVVHSGRVANRAQETAIFVLQRGRCATLGCGNGIAEIDHVVDYAEVQETTLRGLRGLCGSCHDRKKQGHAYRINDDGTITWIRPDGSTDQRERPPPAVA
jgi:hypothetical protein